MKNNFTIKEVRDYWDEKAEIYDQENSRIGPAHEQRFLEALKYCCLNPSEKLLNVWSRTGSAIGYLLPAFPGLEIYNLDVSAKMNEIAKNKFPEEKFFLTDLDKINFPDNFFEHILSLETLEHTPEPPKFLAELFRVLKPGGVMILSLPPQTAELALQIYDFLFSNHGEGPHRFISSKKVKKQLNNAGFELILHKGTLLIPVGPIWLQNLGEKIIDFFQDTPLREMGIRQFYICKK